MSNHCSFFNLIWKHTLLNSYRKSEWMSQRVSLETHVLLIDVSGNKGQATLLVNIRIHWRFIFFCNSNNKFRVIFWQKFLTKTWLDILIFCDFYEKSCLQWHFSSRSKLVGWFLRSVHWDVDYNAERKHVKNWAQGNLQLRTLFIRELGLDF